MLKTISCLLVSFAFLALPAKAEESGKKVDIAWEIFDVSNLQICWDDDCYKAGPADAYGNAALCNAEMREELVARISASEGSLVDMSKIVDVGSIEELTQLLRDDSNESAYAPYADCQIPLDNAFIGVVCVDLEDSTEDKNFIPEGCFYISMRPAF